MSTPEISFVIIGLDEAANLGEAIAALSLQGFGRGQIEIIYVDSGSQDGSLDIAREAGVDLAISIPRDGASAARGRNKGLANVTAPYVHFVDGDTCLDPGWTRLGIEALKSDSTLVGVEGDLAEARPDASIYNAVCGLDWVVLDGQVEFIGGNGLYRVAPLREVAGFDPAMLGGEEPELGARLRARGWRMRHLDVPMARHDLDIRSFDQYLRRCHMDGVSCAMVVRATGGLIRGYWSARLWRTVIQAVLLTGPAMLGLAVLPAAPGLTLVLVVLSFASLLALVGRKIMMLRRSGHGTRLAVAYALHTYLAKLPTAVGMFSSLLRPRNGGSTFADWANPQGRARSRLAEISSRNAKLRSSRR